MNPSLLPYILNGLADGGRHWLYSGFAGLLVWWLILIMWSVPLRVYQRLTQEPVPTVVVYIILGSCLLASVCVAWSLHSALDAYSAWWDTPLGPGLYLNIP